MSVYEQAGHCESYCDHGGMCVLPLGHEGMHDSKYCTWPDADAVTREVADERLRDQPMGSLVLMAQELYERIHRED
jgi:hypothetical protein